jgi:DNA/RNA-binding domain of Phe-tRNA-synthetase-like protein
VFFCHSPALWAQFPQLVPGVLVVRGIHPNVEMPVEPWYARARERLSRGPESELPEVSAWRRAFATMGFKPTQYRSAGEALLRRFRRENDLPRLHPLVDLGNALSLAYAMPVAVLDLAGVDSHIEVRHAAGGEEHLGFGGEVEHVEPGEVIFADAANHAHARRWTFRQSRRSTVSVTTYEVLIVAEGLHATAGADVPALVDELAKSIESLWGPPTHRAVLTAGAPRIEFGS